jgi:hypothetical protein
MSRNDYPPRSPEGLMRGGHTRPLGSTTWGCVGDIAEAKNEPSGAPFVNIGSHGPALAKPLASGASEGNPKGFDPKGGR